MFVRSMFSILTAVLATNIHEPTIEAQNQRIFNTLKRLADSDTFSKIKFNFEYVCPHKIEECEEKICTLPDFGDQKDNIIDLLAVKESYSETSLKNGPAVWEELRKVAGEHEVAKKLLSGLHFSVTTHKFAFYSKVFNTYYSNPAQFKEKFRREYKDNFLYLYTFIRYAVASLTIHKSEVPDAVLELGYKIRAILAEEMDASRKSSHDQVELRPTFDMQEDDLKETMRKENTSTIEFKDSLPKIDKFLLSIVSQLPKEIACLECEKCKLWGTIQAKGLRAAMKVLSNMALNKSEIIFLINFFRQLSITVIESKRMESNRFPHANTLIRSVAKFAKCTYKARKARESQAQ